MRTTYGVSSPKERLAWSFMLRALVYVSWTIAYDAMFKVSSIDKKTTDLWALRRAALLVASGTVWNVALQVSYEVCLKNISKVDKVSANIIQNMAYNAAYNISNTAIKNKVSADQLRAIAFRGAEWAVLNYFLLNIDTIIGEIYFWTLESLPHDQTQDLIKSLESLFPVFEQPNFNLDPNNISYLVYWFPKIASLDWVLHGDQSSSKSCVIF